MRDHGRGLATEAAAMCEWLTANGIHWIEAHVRPRHVASQVVAARIGLQRTHELDDEGEEIWATGSTTPPTGEYVADHGADRRGE